MDIEQLGRTTLHTRVEQWECDFNNHWNVRYYARTFQLAAEAVNTIDDAISPGAEVVQLRHMRFHRELFANAPVQIRSARVADGPHQGAIVHILLSDGRLAATSMETGKPDVGDLPECNAVDLVLALPRGVGDNPAEYALDEWAAPEPFGPIRPAECDHTGALLWEELIRRLALTSNHHISGLGFTPEFVQKYGINRMSAEMRIERSGTVPVGACLWGNSRLVAVGGKSFATEHRIESKAGDFSVRIRQNLLTVDLKTRRAVAVPDFLRALG